MELKIANLDLIIAIFIIHDLIYYKKTINIIIFLKTITLYRNLIILNL